MSSSGLIKKRLQVFVSSTYSDLKPERQAAVAAILKAGHIPAGMELFTAGDKSQFETIKRWIDESDVYMLILGGRYGSVEATTGVSYTELEFDYAYQQGKALFSVVITDDALDLKIKEVGRSCIEQENPQALKLFRDKVLSKVVSFYEDEKDIRLSVYESLQELAGRDDLRGWIPGDVLQGVRLLEEEIERLKRERKEERAPQKSGSRDNPDINEIIDLLRETPVTIPSMGGKSGKSEHLLSVFYLNKEDLISGVTDAFNATENDAFLFYNIVPKLQVYGLAGIERAAGLKYRRSNITKKGLEVIAEIERRRVKFEKDKKAAEKDGKKG